MKLRTELQTRILDNPAIEWRRSRFSAQEAFFVDSREIAHFHNDNEIDVRLTKPEIKRLGWYDSQDARISVRSRSSEWVELKFNSEQDLEFVREMVDIAAVRNRKT